MEQQPETEVRAEWNSRIYRASLNVYGVATIHADQQPIEDVEEHELHRLANDGGAA